MARRGCRRAIKKIKGDEKDKKDKGNASPLILIKNKCSPGRADCARDHCETIVKPCKDQHPPDEDPRGPHYLDDRPARTDKEDRKDKEDKRR